MADETNPWGSQNSPQESTQESSPWGESSPSGDSQEQSSWVDEASQGATQAQDHGFSILEPFKHELIPFDTWIENGLDWLVANFRDFFQTISVPVDVVLKGIENFLLQVPSLAIIVFITLLAWQIANKKLAIGTLLSLIAIGAIGAWSEAMVTLALVFTSVFFCLLFGIPLGIWMSRNDRASATIRPVLDAMQTTPAFVYLIPVVMLFGIGNVPGVIVTIIFALPPIVRLTNLGIRQVPKDLIEASHSFGASAKQMLFKVQLPVAMPTIMAGVNQTLMMALAMVVIASMIAVGGLGQMVLRGIGRLDMGLASVGGVGIVLLAIILDRMTQAMGQPKKDQRIKWYQSGPAGLIYGLFNKNQS